MAKHKLTYLEIYINIETYVALFLMDLRNRKVIARSGFNASPTAFAPQLHSIKTSSFRFIGKHKARPQASRGSRLNFLPQVPITCINDRHKSPPCPPQKPLSDSRTPPPPACPQSDFPIRTSRTRYSLGGNLIVSLKMSLIDTNANRIRRCNTYPQRVF